MILSGHIALAYNSKFTMVFSNTGNNQERQQECGDFCTSNNNRYGSSGLTTSKPSPTPTIQIINSCSPTATRQSTPPLLYSSNIECIKHVNMTGETVAG